MAGGSPTPRLAGSSPAGPPSSFSIFFPATIASYGTPSPKSKIGGVQNWTPDQIPWKELELPERVLPVRDISGFATLNKSPWSRVALTAALPQAQDLHGAALKQAMRSGLQVDVTDVRFVWGTTRVMGMWTIWRPADRV